MIDTGCARASSGGLLQYNAYCHHVGEQTNTDKTEKVFYKLAFSGKTFLGREIVKLPMNKIIFCFDIHIIEEDVPLLLSLTDMDWLGIFYNNPTNQPVHDKVGEMTQAESFYEHLFIRLDALQPSFFIRFELRCL